MLLASSEPLSMKLSGFAAYFLLVLLVVLLPASLAAISVFDVIRLSQGRYSDAEIIRLIQTTDSRFVLSAEDAVRLREAGVTDSVIREMLSRPAPRRDLEPPVSDGAAIPSRPEPLFSGAAYRESGGRPGHAAVTLAGIEVLIVRDEAGFSSPLARARAVAQTLNTLAASASGRFAVRASARDSMVIFESSDGATTDIVRVTPSDVAAYPVGGRRQVSSETLSSFWAALLNDYWAIGVAGKPPRSLADSREGQALTRLSRRLPTGTRDAAAVRAGFDSLARADRERLRKLPAAVPEDLELPIRRSP
jgi:hypothetical protein